MNEETLVAIYDFAIYPYALGDVLTFNVQTAVKCIENKKSRIQLLICCDQNYCSNFEQRSFIKKTNFKDFYKEIFPAFEAQCIECEVLEFDDRKILVEYLKGQKNLDEVNIKEINNYLFHLNYIKNDLSVYLSRIVNKVKNKEKNESEEGTKNKFRVLLGSSYELLYNHLNKNRSIINEFFIRNIYSHKKINLFFKKNNYVPELKINSQYVYELNEFLEKRFQNKKFIAIHIRQRKNEKKLNDASIYRDSNSDVWLNFLKAAFLLKQNIIFILLGRSEEKSQKLLALPNIINLRDFGMNLGHDLAAIEFSKMFMGSSSGFAAFANFYSKPYIITNMNVNSYKAYDITIGSDALPFANPRQKLVYEEESVDLLYNYFKLLDNNV